MSKERPKKKPQVLHSLAELRRRAIETEQFGEIDQRRPYYSEEGEPMDPVEIEAIENQQAEEDWREWRQAWVDARLQYILVERGRPIINELSAAVDVERTLAEINRLGIEKDFEDLMDKLAEEDGVIFHNQRIFSATGLVRLPWYPPLGGRGVGLVNIGMTALH